MTFQEWVGELEDSDQLDQLSINGAWCAAKEDSQITIDELIEQVERCLVQQNTIRGVMQKEIDSLQKENELLNQELNYAFQQCSTCQMPELTARTNKTKKGVI